MTYIIVKNYDHYNRSLGKYISSKKQYDEEMAKGGYVPFEQGEEMAKQAREKARKKYDGLSPEKMDFLNSVKNMADSKGNIKPSERFIKGLQEHGVLPKKLDCFADRLPKHYSEQGGFNNAAEER